MISLDFHLSYVYDIIVPVMRNMNTCHLMEWGWGKCNQVTDVHIVIFECNNKIDLITFITTDVKTELF